MTENQLKELRKRIANAPMNQRGRRQYGPELKREGLRYAEEHLGQGASVGDVAVALGLKAGTLQSWLKRDEKRERAMRAVRVVGERLTEKEEEKEGAGANRHSPAGEAGRGAVVVLANGARIEGLTMRELIELARGLE
jgi:transposase-like protein